LGRLFQLLTGKLAPHLQQVLSNLSSHLLNDGVEETPPQRGCVNGTSGAPSNPSPHSIFVDVEGANVGFHHWHPVSVAAKGSKLCGQADLGGVWEWTSTVLERHEGYEPMSLYPGYSGK
jgi:formylglycine-generating enzyme required for sulfatase activity